MDEMKEHVIDRFTIIRGLKAYISGELDNPNNPYWNAKEEVFEGGRMADEAIQILEADYQILNDLMDILERLKLVYTR